MSEIINAFLLVFAALFPVVNPLGGAPIFLSLTSGSSEAERNRLARGVAFNGFWLLLGSLLLGSEILEFFGITIPVVRVAGGLLVTAMGWKLLNEGSAAPERETVHKEAKKSEINDSFYPLTLPLTVGPGSISVALTLGSHRQASGESPEYALIAAAILGLAAVALSIYVCYRFAGPLAKFLGKVGINVLVRLSAFILICIGIQIGWSGVSALMATLGQPA
ncbi:MAG TPA: MarC family protein [Xanthobacteraceae bacterium]|jgi:multiple antibiotic resistance protein|nr:MarC family protein [Xanthobacteraceae bacterium]